MDTLISRGLKEQWEMHASILPVWHKCVYHLNVCRLGGYFGHKFASKTKNLFSSDIFECDVLLRQTYKVMKNHTNMDKQVPT